MGRFLAGVTVRRERRWTSVGAIPTRELLGIMVSGSLGQEVRSIDISDISEPSSGELAYGSMIEAYSCVGTRERSPQQARVSVEWIETTDLYPRQASDKP